MQYVADTVQGPKLRVGRLPEALPESFVTYRAFRVNPENAIKVQEFVHKVAEPLIRCKTYSGVKYWIIAFRKFSPRNKLHYSRIPQECKGRAKEVVKFYYNLDGSVQYVANKYAMVKMS